MIWTIIDLVNTLLPTFIHTRAREYHSSRLVSTCVSIQWLRYASVAYGYPTAYTRSPYAIPVPTWQPVDNLWIPVQNLWINRPPGGLTWPAACLSTPLYTKK